MELQAPPTFSLKHQRIFKQNNSGHAIIKLSNIYKKFYYYKNIYKLCIPTTYLVYLLLQSLTSVKNNLKLTSPLSKLYLSIKKKKLMTTIHFEGYFQKIVVSVN